MSTLKMTRGSTAVETADEVEARADELAADEALRRAAVEAEILRLRARAKRLRSTTLAPPKAEVEHMTRAEYARRSRVSEATVSRWIWQGMPTIPVGTTHRIDPVAADEWRRARPKTATTPKKKSKSKETDDNIDISDVLAGAGLSSAGGLS